MAAKKYLGIDMGARRIGLAVGDDEIHMASPLATVSPDELVSKIDAAGPFEAFVIGLPRGLDGQETAQTLAVHRWVDDLLGHRDEPVIWQDEAGTSSVAEDELKASGKPYDRSDIDAAAAALILQDYLDSL